MKNQLNPKIILTLSAALFISAQTNLLQADDSVDKKAADAAAANNAKAAIPAEKERQSKQPVNSENQDIYWGSLPQDRRDALTGADNQAQQRPAYQMRDNTRPAPPPSYQQRDYSRTGNQGPSYTFHDDSRSGPPPSYGRRDYNRGSDASWGDRRDYGRPARPPWDRPYNRPHKKKKSFFSRDRFSDAWDDMLNAPSDMGEMPGGWTAPSVSMPNPVDVSDEFGDAAVDAPDQMRNVYEDNRRSNQRYDDRPPYYNRPPGYYGR